MPIGRYLAGIAALLWDPTTDKYLLLRRSTEKDFGAEMWECVTGRVDQGEGYEEALHREVREEINIEIQPEFLIATTHFYRGAPVPENELLGVMYGCTPISLDGFRISAEHSEYRWMRAEEVYVMLPKGNWLRNIIERAEQLKQHTPASLRQTFRDKGFAL
jgi:8-oxo-dGTP diphosphatase